MSVLLSIRRRCCLCFAQWVRMIVKGGRAVLLKIRLLVLSVTSATTLVVATVALVIATAMAVSTVVSIVAAVVGDTVVVLVGTFAGAVAKVTGGVWASAISAVVVKGTAGGVICASVVQRCAHVTTRLVPTVVKHPVLPEAEHLPIISD